MTRAFIALVFISIPLSVDASEWNCVNEIEINCRGGNCVSSESFTPMSISFTDSGNVEICAYSGCWKGKGVTFLSGKYLYITAPALKWNGVSPNPASVAISLNRSTKIAALQVADFAMPVTCTQKVSNLSNKKKIHN